MDESQVFVLALATLVLAMFTFNLWRSLKALRTQRHRRRRVGDRRSTAPHFRGFVKSLILWIGVMSIWTGRIVATYGADPETRRFLSAINAAAVSGALLIGGAFLVVSWLTDSGTGEGEIG